MPLRHAIKPFFSLLFILLQTAPGQSQEYVPGSILQSDESTRNGYIRLTYAYEMAKGIWFSTDATGTDKVWYSASDLDGFALAADGTIYHARAIEPFLVAAPERASEPSPRRFLKLIQDGRLALYEYYTSDQSIQLVKFDDTSGTRALYSILKYTDHRGKVDPGIAYDTLYLEDALSVGARSGNFLTEDRYVGMLKYATRDCPSLRFPTQLKLTTAAIRRLVRDYNACVGEVSEVPRQSKQLKLLVGAYGGTTVGAELRGEIYGVSLEAAYKNRPGHLTLGLNYAYNISEDHDQPLGAAYEGRAYNSLIFLVRYYVSPQHRLTPYLGVGMGYRWGKYNRGPWVQSSDKSNLPDLPFFMPVYLGVQGRLGKHHLLRMQIGLDLFTQATLGYAYAF